MVMFCTNCGDALPEGAKFCPNCGVRLAEPLVADAAIAERVNVPETPAEAAAEVFETAEPEQLTEAVETFEAAAEPVESEPVAVPAEEPAPAVPVPAAAEAPAEPGKAVPMASEAPEPAPVKAVPKGLHFTATLSIVLTAVTFLFATIALLGLLVQMHPAMVILMAIFAILTTPLALGFGIAAFIIGLKNKRTATWVIGLAAALLAVLHFICGVIYLVGGIVYAAM